MKQLSILVVSRTPELLSRLLASLDSAWSGNADTVEVLCSWNGSDADASRIQPARLPFRIAQREPYHFARNMNALAAQASGEVVVFANDDLIADPGALDAAYQRLAERAEVGIVGACLRTSEGELAHAGISFNREGSAYHRLQTVAALTHASCSQETLVPAVTGAFLAMRLPQFSSLQFSEDFQVCGEDVVLCLECRRLLGLGVLFCPAMSGIHDAESTRAKTPGQEGQSVDMQAMQIAYRNMRQRADQDALLMELQLAQDEADTLRSLCSELQAREAPLYQRLQALEAEAASLQEGLAKALSEQQRSHAQSQAVITRLELEASLHSREQQRLLARVQLLEAERSVRR